MMKNSICWNYMPFKYIFLFALATTVALFECFSSVCLFVCLNRLIFFYEQWTLNTPTQTNHSCCNSTEMSCFASFFSCFLSNNNNQKLKSLTIIFFVFFCPLLFCCFYSWKKKTNKMDWMNVTLIPVYRAAYILFRYKTDVNHC